MIQGQLPDLKSVMFPGDNPFAYPKQPISTLDTMPNLPFGNDQTSPDRYNSTSGMNDQQQYQSQNLDQGMYSDGYRGPEQHMQPQFFNMNNMMSDEPTQMQHSSQQRDTLHVPGQGGDDDYWSHAPARGHFRTGLTPGGPGINLDLDDIFGQGQSWSMPMNLAMPGGSQQQQQEQPMQWVSHGGQNWL